MNVPDSKEEARNPPIEALAYAPRLRGRRWLRQLRLAILIALGTVVLGLIINHGTDYGHWGEFCENCGAHSRVAHFSVYGIGGNYSRQTQEGWVSEWIQVHEGRACDHSWKPTGGTAGGFLTGQFGFTCRDLSLDVGVRRLEFSSASCLERVFGARPDQDAQFLANFKKYALRGEHDEQNFYGSLCDEVVDCETEAR